MISVCMATYNGGRYIREQIESILMQLAADDELVASDDGSKDDTLDVIASLKDPRIKVFHNEGRHGVVPNFENALAHSTGDIIFFSDQDDVWDKDKVKKCIAALDGADLVVHNSTVHFDNGEQADLDFFKLRHSGSGYLKNLYKNSFVGSCMAFRKEVKDYVLPFPKHILWHDMWIGLMVERHGRTRFISDKLLYYRRHDNNASATSEKSSFSFLFQLQYRFWMLWYSITRQTKN